MPDDGQSMLDLIDPVIGAMVMEIVRNYGEGWYLPVDQSANPSLSHQPAKTGTQPLRLHNQQAVKSIPHTYIYCTEKSEESMAARMTQISAEKAKARGWNYYELASDHEPEQVMPDDVTQILLELVQS